MLGLLKSIIEQIEDNQAIIDVNGVGYIVNCSSKTLDKLGQAGDKASLLIETIVREDAITLFGFADATEKQWFNTLTAVQGVGAKVCIAILSTLNVVEINNALAAQDKTMFTRVSGVGPKLAARIVTELKDKAQAFSTSGDNVVDLPTNNMADTGILNDAVSALTNLGITKFEAASLVKAELSNNPSADLQALISASLKKVGS